MTSENAVGEPMERSHTLGTRQRTWDESTTDERIERLRYIIKQHAHTIADLMDRVKLLEGHSHANGGKILVDYAKVRAEKHVIAGLKNSDYI